jgi:predicted AAA+ superfamily ATPase
LIIFDEIQFSNHALNALKYFNEQGNQYHLACAGSLLGIKMSQPDSFPVGKVNFLELYPLTFLEFLDAAGEKELRKIIEETADFTPYPEPFHKKFIDILKKYFFVGGMPEAVKVYCERENYNEVRQIQKEINDSYVLDFAKHAVPSNIVKQTVLWESIPGQLGKENKKFIFSAIKKSARGREYENAIQWLEDAGLILRAFLVSTGRPPLKTYVDRSSFKVFALDIGLLGALTNVPAENTIIGDNLFTEYKGAFVENYVAQQLKARGNDLYFWKSNGVAEIDFVCEAGGSVYPLEAKAGINPKSKSLQVYDERYNPCVLLRTTLLNLKQNGNIRNYPLYAISLFPKIK